MLKNQKLKMLLASIITLIPIPIGLLIWDKLPDQIATHWDFAGNPNGWSSKEIAVIGMPLFLLFVHWICVAGTKADPKAASHPKQLMALLYWSCPAVSIFCMGSTYAEALGYHVSITHFGAILVGISFMIIGNYLPKCPHNYTMGIRIPWTLHSEENWNRTHRFAGPIWVIFGILFPLLTFLGYPKLCTALMFIAVFVPIIYSYLDFKKYESK